MWGGASFKRCRFSARTAADTNRSTRGTLALPSRQVAGEGLTQRSGSAAQSIQGTSLVLELLAHAAIVGRVKPQREKAAKHKVLEAADCLPLAGVQRHTGAEGRRADAGLTKMQKGKLKHA